MKALLKSSGSLSDVNGWTWPRNDSFKMMTRNTCIDRIWRQNTMQIYWNEKYGFYSFNWRNVHFSHEMINMTYSFRVYPLKLIFFFWLFCWLLFNSVSSVRVIWYNSDCSLKEVLWKPEIVMRKSSIVFLLSSENIHNIHGVVKYYIYFQFSMTLTYQMAAI